MAWVCVYSQSVSGRNRVRLDQVRQIGVRVVTKTLTVAVLCVALLAAPAWAQVSTVVAGQAVAGIRIGGNVTDAISALGALFEKQDTDSGKYTIYDWPLRPLLVIAEKDSGRVVLVLIAFTDLYRTDRGITGGSERPAVESAYGREFASTESQSSIRLVYDSLGIAFDIAKAGVMSGRVVQIFVFMPGLWKQITEGT